MLLIRCPITKAFLLERIQLEQKLSPVLPSPSSGIFFLGLNLIYEYLPYYGLYFQ
jgi:hypothetical protein